MSTTIKSIFDMQWQIGKPFSDGDGSPGVAIDTLGNSGNRIFKVADLLDAMRAEGVLDAVEIITELPEVEESPTAVSAYVDGFAYGVAGEWADGSAHRKQALRSLALARYCEARYTEAEKSRAAALRGHRQRIVSRHASGLGGHEYDHLDVNGKYIVDTIRELEDKLANA